MTAGTCTKAATCTARGYMAGRALTFFVPVHPVSVNRQRQFRTSFRKSPELAAYQEAVAFHGRNARIATDFEPLAGDVECVFVFCYLENRPDNDGPQKPTQDALAAQYGKPGKHAKVGAGLFRNDKQVVSTTSRKEIGAREGVEITVRESPLPASAQNTLEGLKRLGAPKRRATTRLTPSVRRYTP